MARALSSQKALRRSVSRAIRNRAHRSQIKTVTRKTRDAITARDIDGAEKAFRQVVQILDRNAARRTIHPNTAARRKSRLAKRINALVAASKK